MLKNKTVILGVTGSIAAYKAATLASLLKKQNCDVHVIMTKNATEIITPLTFERLTGNKCITDTFDKNIQYEVKHIVLAKMADMVMIAPATANFIGKTANGIADDMLTTTVMACKCPVYISPAMNTAMFENPIVKDNMKKLENYGYHIIEPAYGRLACGDTGKGKMPEPGILAEYIYNEIAMEKDLKGKKVIVTAGATCEAIDPVRYITNHSGGKMGCEIAKACVMRGAETTLICGNMTVEPPMFAEVIRVKSAEDMFNAVVQKYPEADIVIKAAAVADYTPVTTAENKIKKSGDHMSIPLKRTKDILKYLGENKNGQYLCGFSMETENLVENSVAKLKSKNADMIVANNLNVKGAGFGVDTNVATIITKDKNGDPEKPLELPIMTKSELAHIILDNILKRL